MNIKPVKIGLIGSGAISYTYLNTLTSGFAAVEVVGCSDIIPERSKARAKLFGIRQLTNDEIFSDPEIELVVITTELWNHHHLIEQALNAGKHVYTEKAMDHSYEGALENYNLAKSKGLLLGSAPDCYMGSAWQTARKLIDDGYIGIPLIAYSQCMRGYGAHERGGMQRTGVKPHPLAGKHGTTITYDMCGYYINVLINMFGAVNRVSGYSQVFTGDRSQAHTLNSDYGKKLSKDIGENIMLGALEFESGLYASLVICSESYMPEVPRVDIYGTDGQLTLPDPNYFGGWGNEVYLTRKGSDREKFLFPFTHGFSETDPNIIPKHGILEPGYNGWRGIAVVDMAYAIRRGRPARSSADLALHSVEIVDAIDKSNADNKVHIMKSRPIKPAALKPGHYGSVNVMESSLDT
ncbi:MAG: Gfo/Idh/MocA family oxidoreductase [Oscillospiraceae bacterium]|jgi:predicted dehydrogenase|nr:Gfo/Idh/MocA family oxidoreductase [Oscillospiraceae bacterium]